MWGGCLDEGSRSIVQVTGGSCACTRDQLPRSSISAPQTLNAIYDPSRRASSHDACGSRERIRQFTFTSSIPHRSQLLLYRNLNPLHDPCRLPHIARTSTVDSDGGGGCHRRRRRRSHPPQQLLPTHRRSQPPPRSLCSSSSAGTAARRSQSTCSGVCACCRNQPLRHSNSAIAMGYEGTAAARATA